MGAACELVLDDRWVEPSRGKQDVRVAPEVSDLGDQALVVFADTGQCGFSLTRRLDCTELEKPRRIAGRTSTN